MVESPLAHHEALPEKQRVDLLVKSLAKLGYEYDQVLSHVRSNVVHFDKPIIPDRIYPHFHLLYKPNNDSFSIHIDSRQHRSMNQSPQLSDERMAIYARFKEESAQAQNPQIKFLFEKLSALAMHDALFQTSRDLDGYKGKRKFVTTRMAIYRKSKRMKGGTLGRFVKRKYDNLETWYISDWEPLDIKSIIETSRHSDDEADKID